MNWIHNFCLFYYFLLLYDLELYFSLSFKEYLCLCLQFYFWSSNLYRFCLKTSKRVSFFPCFKLMTDFWYSETHKLHFQMFVSFFPIHIDYLYLIKELLFSWEIAGLKFCLTMFYSQSFFLKIMNFFPAQLAPYSI